MSTTREDSLLDYPRPTGLRMSYEDFLELGDEYRHAEWVNGEVIMMAAVMDDHAWLVMFLSTLLKAFCDAKDLGDVFAEPFQMKTGPDLPGRAPDVFFVKKNRLSLLKRKNFEGAADLVIEVISRGTRRVDRIDKFQEYEAGGVPEYWIIDPHRKISEFYQLVNGRYEEKDPDEKGIYYASAVAGFWIDTNWLTRRPLPSTITCLREIGAI
jgi:Uma2 family endonuclease